MKYVAIFLLTISCLLSAEFLTAQKTPKKPTSKTVKAATSKAEEVHVKKMQQEQFDTDIRKLKLRPLKPLK